MLATAHLHDANEAANRVLPAVAPLGVDAVQEVRHTALQVLISFTKLLQDHSRTLDDQAQASGECPCCVPFAVWLCPRQPLISLRCSTVCMRLLRKHAHLPVDKSCHLSGCY